MLVRVRGHRHHPQRRAPRVDPLDQRCGFRATTIERDVFTEAKGYPPQLEANGIPVRDSITFTLLLDAAALVD